MKKSILLLVLFASAIFAKAQTTTDLSLKMKSPTDGQIVKLTNTFNLSYTLKNNGPDKWANGVDIIKIDITFNGNAIPSLVNQFKFNKDFIAGDSITFNLNNLKISGQAAGTLAICAVGVVNMPTVTDPDMTNNSSCSNVEFVDNAGISDNSGTFDVDFVKPAIYPNPSNGITALSYGLSASTNINVSIYDMNGKLVKEVVNEKQIPGNYISYIDATELNSGVYFVTLRTDEFSRSSKLVITK
jgi:hypothetical protein